MDSLSCAVYTPEATPPFCVFPPSCEGHTYTSCAAIVLAGDLSARNLGTVASRLSAKGRLLGVRGAKLLLARLSGSTGKP